MQIGCPPACNSLSRSMTASPFSNQGFRSVRRPAESTVYRQARARPRRVAADHRKAAMGNVSSDGPCRRVPGRSSPPLAVGRAHPAISQRQLNVLENGQIPDQVEALENESDFLVPDAGARRRNERLATALPFSGTSSVGVSSNPRMESKVDLPQPEGPAIETYSPSGWQGECQPVRAFPLRR